MRFDEALSLLLDLVEERLGQHSAPGGLLDEQYAMLVRADRTTASIRYPILSIQPDIATPRDATLSGALTIDRDVPLRLVAQVEANDPGKGYMACIGLAARAQEALLTDPDTGEEMAMLERPDGAGYAAFSLTVGNLVMPAPIRGQQSRFQSIAYVTAAVADV